jgi:hypothetical protein
LKLINPLGFGAALHNKQNILNHCTNRQTVAGNNDTGYSLTCGQPFMDMVRYGSLIVGQQDATCLSRPTQYRRVIGARDFQILNPEDVKVRLSTKQSSHNAIIEVFIGQEFHCSAGLVLAW